MGKQPNILHKEEEFAYDLSQREKHGTVGPSRDDEGIWPKCVG